MREGNDVVLGCFDVSQHIFFWNATFPTFKNQSFRSQKGYQFCSRVGVSACQTLQIISCPQLSKSNSRSLIPSSKNPRAMLTPRDFHTTFDSFYPHKSVRQTVSLIHDRDSCDRHSSPKRILSAVLAKMLHPRSLTVRP